MGLHMPSLGEFIVIAAIGLLLFGKRLPEVGRSLGKGIVEFKKGLKGIEEEVDQASARQATAPEVKTLPDAKFDPYTGKAIGQPEHKFDPYTGKPVGETAEADTHETADSHS
ncbi:MAG TPA: twin-arginine translocase TatA/TatE family subunit [Tepidisphaeraceae bacterium]|jgi:sec-independent protein translocase protein TatA|nr:twin-arginine translocase TatA/TatE family subunit [Tepidisphaeraceae bacterium]